jgi:predicted methyltransferase
MDLYRTALALLTGLAMVPALAGAKESAAMKKYGTDDKALLAVVDSEWRSAEAKSRDTYRHPIQALTFWGLKSGMTVLEVQPGAGWWTDILAPYTQLTGGRFYVTGADLGNADLPESSRKARADYEAKLAEKQALYGKVEVLNWGPKSAPLPRDTFDFILTARSVHGWMGQPGMPAKVFKDFYDAMKKGGILAVEQHRANPGPQDPKAESGYVTEETVIALARAAGFKLVARSEINANPKDTKDHPFGVWTLPPNLRSTAYGSGKEDDPTFDHSKYAAIGESDRMTLKFIKP